MFPRLNGLRALAILLVLSIHGIQFESHGSHIKELVIAWIRGGQLGVQIFFVLSGFLITRACLRSKSSDLTEYFRKRIAKIIPPYYLSLSLALILFYLETQTPWAQIVHAFLSFAVFLEPTLPHPEKWQGGFYWTLRIEVIFYLLVPALVFLLGGRRKWGIPIFFLGASLFSVLVQMLYPNSFSGLVSQYVYFGAGSVVACLPLLSFQKPSPKGLHIALLGGIAVLVLTLGWFDIHGKVVSGQVLAFGEPLRWFFDIVFSILIIGLMLPWPINQKDIVDQLLTSKTMGFIALISYEIYLFHVLLIVFFHMTTGIEYANGSIKIFILSRILPTLLSIPVAAVVYFCFSKPVHDLIVPEKK